MGKLTDAIRESATKHTVEWILALLAPLPLLLVLALRSFVFGQLVPAMSKEQLAYISVGTITVLLLIAAYVFYLRRKLKIALKTIQESLFYRFGVFWSKQGVPHCPNCKSALPQSTRGIFVVAGGSVPKPRLFCLQCDKGITLYDDSGNKVSLADAKKLLEMETMN